ncbi:MAG: putative aminopeptidase [Chthonomonadales bacterium]|nr:putative aminopeptidase [Chthonomonadales bacterium]
MHTFRALRAFPFRSVWLLPALAGALGTLSATAQDSITDAAFSPATIHKQIAYLASDALGGRGSGEAGNEKAAQYIAAEFARYGLKPLGTSKERDPNALPDGSGYYQPFRFHAGHVVGKHSHLTFVIKDKVSSPQPGLTFTYHMPEGFEPSSVSAGGKAVGNVVFAGYGIHAPQANHDDFSGVDVKGKIVLMWAGSPGNDPHGPLADLADIRRKTLNARELGAVAVLVIVPDEAFAEAGSRTSAETADAGLPVLRIKQSQITKTIAANLFRVMPGKRDSPISERVFPDPFHLRHDADAGKNVSFETSGTARLVADVKQVEKVTANVVGMIEGSDPTLKPEVVVIGAHLDHLGMGGPGSLAKSSAPAVHHGADDNASGAAGVLAMARYFGNTPHTKAASLTAQLRQRPRRSLVLICFSGEELGLLGSAYYTAHPIVPLAKTVAMINMDMVGRLRDNKLIAIGSGTAKEWDGLLDSLNQTAGFTLSRSMDGFGASDQQSFYNKEIPVLFFFTGSHPEYHTPADTIDLINAPGEAKVLKMVAEAAERIADNPERPTYQKVAITGGGGSPGFRVYFGSIPDYAAMVEGVQLTGVREGSPADKAGLKAGDIIIKFGDLTVKSVQDYTVALSGHKPGDVVKIVVQRGTETVTLTATLAARPE